MTYVASLPLVREKLMRELNELNLNRTFVGFSDFFDQMINRLDMVSQTSQINYPPYNIRQTQTGYVIEMAVAGFGMDDLKVEQTDEKLVVTGTKKKIDSDDYCYQGLAGRDFTRTFTIADNIEVSGGNLTDGLLTITLTRNLPEVNVRKIDLTTGGQGEPELLAEHLTEAE